MVFDSITGLKTREADFSATDSENYKSRTYGYLANLAYSSDGSLIAFAGSEMVERAAVWDAQTHTRLDLPKILEDEDSTETAIAFSPDNRFIAIGNERGKIGVFDVNSRLRLALIENPGSSFPITALSFSPNGEFLLAAIRTQKVPAVRVWEWSSGEEMATINHGSLVVDIIINQDTQRLYTLAAGNEVRVWEILSAPEIAEGGIDKTAFEQSMPVLLSVLCSAAMAVNFNPVTFTSCIGGISSVGSIRGDSAVPRIALAPDGNKLVIADNRATQGMGPDRIVMFDAETIEKLWTSTASRGSFDSLFAWVHDVAYSPDGETIAVAGGGIRLFDAETGEERIPTGQVEP
jgi:WD40 repeat protein